jgi:hypothetical protein
MPVGSDFTIIQFTEHLGANEADLPASWATFVGNQTSVKTFNIDNPPQGEAYLLIQTLHVGAFSHRIFINGVGLNGYNLPQHEGWSTWMVVIQDGVLVHGANTLQVVRDEETNDNFVVGHVVVHWREVVNIEMP